MFAFYCSTVFCYVLTHHISAQCCFSYRNHSFNLHQLTCSANQRTGFYMNCNTGLIWVNTKTARKLNTGNDLFVFPLYRSCIDSLYCLSTLSGQLFVFYCIFSLLQASNFFFTIAPFSSRTCFNGVRQGSSYSRMDQVKFVKGQTISLQIFKIYLVHSWIPWPIDSWWLILLKYFVSVLHGQYVNTAIFVSKFWSCNNHYIFRLIYVHIVCCIHISVIWNSRYMSWFMI